MQILNCLSLRDALFEYLLIIKIWHIFFLFFSPILFLHFIDKQSKLVLVIELSCSRIQRPTATCLIMRLPYPVLPNRFRYLGLDVTPCGVLTCDPRAKGARDPKTLHAPMHRLSQFFWGTSFPPLYVYVYIYACSTSVQSICYCDSSLY